MGRGGVTRRVHGSMSSPLSCVLALLLLLLLCGCATGAQAASASYTLQRRLGSHSAWQTVTTFTLKQKRQLPPRLVVQGAQVTSGNESTTAATTTLQRENKSALVAADVVYYRVLPAVANSSNNSGDDNNDDEATAMTSSAAVQPVAMIAVTPCTLIRGFDAVDSRTVVLREQLKVVPGAGVGVLGLQVSSSTNMFHSKMQSGDECDRSIVERLFPVVRMVTELGVVRPTEPATMVSYDDLRLMSMGGGPGGAGAEGGRNGSRRGGGAAGAARVTVRKVRNAKGEMVEEEVPVEERSFLQKYWMYIVLGVGMTIARSIKG